MNLLKVLTLIFLSITIYASPKDSIGVEVKDGVRYVLHKVEAKETLYSLSRRYDVKVDEIKKNNPQVAEGLKIGDIIKLPVALINVSPKQTTSVPTVNYQVQSGETVYSICQKFNISQDELYALNPSIKKEGLKKGASIAIPNKIPSEVKSSSVEVKTNTNGDIIHDVKSGDTYYSISKKYNVSVDDLKKINPNSNNLSVGTQLVIKKGDKTDNNIVVKDSEKENNKEDVEENLDKDPTNENKRLTEDSPQQFKRINEKGNASVMPTKPDAPKFQALHKTAPIGTIIQVTNENNGQTIFVRVVGTLEANENKYLLKLSSKAMERLGANSASSIPVNIMYIP